MSCFLSLFFFVVLGVGVQASGLPEVPEQEAPKSILRRPGVVCQKRVTFASGIFFETKPLVGIYAKKAVQLKQSQQKRNERLDPDQLLEKKRGIKIKNFSFQQENKGDLSPEEQQDFDALKTQSQVFQQKKLEIRTKKEKLQGSLKDNDTTFARARFAKEVPQKSLQNISSQDDSSDSSTQEMLSDLDEEAQSTKIVKNTKPLLRRDASSKDLEKPPVATLKRPRLVRAQAQVFFPKEELNPFFSTLLEKMDALPLEDKRDRPLKKKKLSQNTSIETDQVSFFDPQPLFSEGALDGPSSSAFSSNEKTFLMEHGDARSRPASSINASVERKKGVRAIFEEGTSEEREAPQPLPIERHKKHSILQRTSSFRITDPEEIKAFFEKKSRF